MVLFQLCPAHVRWLWCVIICVSLGGCSPTYHFRYQYTMVAPDGSNEGFENERVQVRVTPTAEAGVTPYTFTFRITDVEVQAGAAQTN